MRNPDELRHDLLKVLLKVPVLDSRKGRDAQLAGMPSLFLARNEEGNTYGDLLLLVGQLWNFFGANGEWRLLQFVDNVLLGVDGTDAGIMLRQVRKELEEERQRHRPVQVHPAEVAQVHLFDLRQPVLICIGKLPPFKKASGFVIPTPTPRLLGYFCDSLKQRGAGAGYRVWGRHEVAATGMPMVVDPIRTTVNVVASKSDKFRSLLAMKHVLWPIYVDNAADAAALWQHLEGAFAKTLEHHLIITFGMPEGMEVPPGMTLLPAPIFTSQDISDWVTAVAETLSWRQEQIDWWAKLILVNCCVGQEIASIEMVYQQLELHSGLITQNRNPDDLMNALKDLEVIGG